MKSIIYGVVLAALVNPSLADEYWVDYNYSTQKCSIVIAKSQHPAAATAQGFAAATTEGVVPDSANVGAGSSAPTNTSSGDNNLDPTAAVIAWAGKKDVAGAAWYDAQRTLLGTAMRTPEQIVTEYKVIAVMWAIWVRETAASEAARSDAANALIGTVSQSREMAERKLRIMRKCGVAN